MRWYILQISSIIELCWIYLNYVYLNGTNEKQIFMQNPSLCVMCFHQIIWYKLTLTFFEDNLAINMWKLYGCVLIVSYIHCFIDYWLGNLSTNFHTLESLTSIALDNMDGLGSLYSYYCQKRKWHINGLAQDYSNSSALEMELLQSCAKPSIYIV